MTQQLEDIFGELGISQYLDAFVDQGFDTWDTILDITESDLDALGVKLGHRRKLQRKIANFRGVAPDAALTSPTQSSTDDARGDAHRPDAPRPENREALSTTPLITKRKYRRHPKADENAPERPPSAYVLFSNKMREDLKGRNLTFTEIAKLVGENWQNLSQAEKEPYETQAQTAKDKYNQDLASYKKTAEYRKYMSYLQDFKAKHSHQTQDKDGSKRVKLSDGGSNGLVLTNGVHNGTSPPRARSDSDSQHGSEPPPTREQRIGSTASLGDGPPPPLYLGSASAAAPYRTSPPDELLHSPATSLADRAPEMSPPLSTSPRELPPSSSSTTHPSRRNSLWLDGQPRHDSTSSQRSLPSLSDMFDRQPPPPHVNGDMTNGYGPGPFHHHRSSRASNGSPGPPPSLVNGDSRPPSLHKNYSSAGSTSSSLSYPRTPMEGPLPIHALLQGKSPGGGPLDNIMPPSSGPLLNGHATTAAAHSPESKGPSMSHHLLLSNGDLPPNSVLANGTGYFASPPPITTPPSSHQPHPMVNGLGVKHPPPSLKRRAPSDSEGTNLDGLGALLRAGEMVDRLPR